MKISNPFSLSKQVSFDFSGSIDEGILLLSQFVGKLSFRPKFDDGLVGKLSKEQIEIYLHRPFSRNFLIPVFYGKFVNNGSKRELVGQFKIHKYVKMTFYLGLIGIVAFWIYVACADHELLQARSQQMTPLWACIGSIVFMYIGLYLCRPIALKDIGRIEEQIRNVLTKGSI